ncbi:MULTISPECIES: class I SAM-dependent methyltransferase [unclassified Streptomyces]|uniref:class I SAM-dependent methyltransferase n=1 Tax=unclassified Streptomyces TaxID=2593676 RepID=UPI00036BC09F|nr:MULTISPECIES: class I SAM-dependent methyltransferase [unclassified Streptomyces]MYT32481.1 methyltransferase [Streptomyces sp. SID8354]
MLAEVFARSGRALLEGFPPDGREYWAARFWDRAAAEQHVQLRPEFLTQKETIADLLRTHGQDAKSVVEVACGTGEFTDMAAKLTPAAEITAIDISAEGLARTAQRVKHDNLRLVEGDFWADNDLEQADLVQCLDAIHHLGDLRQVLTRLRSMVKPGGIFIGNLWTGDHFHEFQRKRYGVAAHLTRTASFLGTALIIRASAGRLKTGAYRTQLTPSDEAVAVLRSVFDEVLEVRKERYFMGFACRVNAGPRP